MRIVYLLRSQKTPGRVYVGLCSNLKHRLAEHNAGECKTTSLARPWTVEVAVYFRDTQKAHAFERYLKTGSGRPFSKRHLQQSTLAQATNRPRRKPPPPVLQEIPTPYWIATLNGGGDKLPPKGGECRKREP